MKLFAFAFLLAAPLTAAMAQASASASTATPATAATAAAVTVRPGAVIYSADGRTIGRVDRIQGAGSSAASASVIYNGSFVSIPLATLTQDGRRYVTSLTMAQLRR